MGEVFGQLKGFHPRSDGGLVEPDAVTLGNDDVGVVKDPVYRRGGQRLGMISSKPLGQPRASGGSRYAEPRTDH